MVFGLFSEGQGNELSNCYKSLNVNKECLNVNSPKSS